MRCTQQNAQIAAHDARGFYTPIGKSQDGRKIVFSLVAPNASGYGGPNEDRRIAQPGYSSDKVGSQGFPTIGSREYSAGYSKHRQDLLFSGFVCVCSVGRTLRGNGNGT